MKQLFHTYNNQARFLGATKYKTIERLHLILYHTRKLLIVKIQYFHSRLLDEPEDYDGKA